MTIRGQDDEVMQAIEVLVVPCQDGPPVTNGVGQVDLVAASGQSDVGWDLDIVAVAAPVSMLVAPGPTDDVQASVCKRLLVFA